MKGAAVAHIGRRVKRSSTGAFLAPPLSTSRWLFVADVAGSWHSANRHPGDQASPSTEVPVRTPGPGDDPAVAPQAAARPESAADAVAMVLTGLGWLAGADLASAPPAALAEVLRGLERATSVHLAAFTAQAGYEEDGHGSPRTWLRWQTKVTLPAANAAMAWARRLNEHPAIDEALTATQISVSWARQVCEWTDALPEHARS